MDTSGRPSFANDDDVKKHSHSDDDSKGSIKDGAIINSAPRVHGQSLPPIIP